MSEQFEKEITRVLRQGTERVDQATRDELAQRRRAVLEAANQVGRWRRYRVPAGAAAAAVLVAVLVLQPQANQSLPVVAADDGELDMEILLAEESLELYEDLEFYEWLDTVGDAG